MLLYRVPSCDNRDLALCKVKMRYVNENSHIQCYNNKNVRITEKHLQSKLHEQWTLKQ